MNGWVNEWKYYTGIFSTSPQPVCHHRSRTGGARSLWHLSILATDSILLACRSERKTMDAGCRAFNLSLKPQKWFQTWLKLMLQHINSLFRHIVFFFFFALRSVSRCVCVFFSFSTSSLKLFHFWGFVVALIWAHLCPPALTWPQSARVCVNVCVSLFLSGIFSNAVSLV